MHESSLLINSTTFVTMMYEGDRERRTTMTADTILNVLTVMPSSPDDVRTGRDDVQLVSFSTAASGESSPSTSLLSSQGAGSTEWSLNRK